VGRPFDAVAFGQQREPTMKLDWALVGPWIPPISRGAGPSGPRTPPGPLGRACGGTLMFFGLISVAVGCWVFTLSWRKYQARRRAFAFAEQAVELTEEVEPGEIIGIEGRVVGGSPVDPTTDEGPRRYSDHLLVEDDRGRVIRLGIPGRGEVPDVYRAGDVVFAVGELNERSEGSAFRLHQEIDSLTRGRARTLWIQASDRATALRSLRVGFIRSCGEGPALVVAGCVLVMCGALVGY
jgi:hypothetical protein